MSKQLPKTAVLFSHYDFKILFVPICYNWKHLLYSSGNPQPPSSRKPSFQALIMIYIDNCFLQMSPFRGFNIVHTEKPADKLIDWLDGRFLSGSRILYLKRKFLLLATVQKLKGNCLRYEISDICSHLQVDKFVLIRVEISSYAIPGEFTTKKFFSKKSHLKQWGLRTEVIKGEKLD